MQILILPLSILLVVSYAITQLVGTSSSTNQFSAIAASENANNSSSKDKENKKATTEAVNTVSTNEPTEIIASPSSSTTPSSSNDKTTGNNETNDRVEKIIEKVQKVLETPIIKNPTDSEKLRGKYKIEVVAPEATSVDLSLQTALGPAKSFHLSLVTSDGPKFVYEYDSTNTPNWTYNLVAKANYSFNQSLLAQGVTFLVDNPVSETIKEKEVRNQVLERLGLTQALDQGTNLAPSVTSSPSPSVSPSPTPTQETPKTTTNLPSSTKPIIPTTPTEKKVIIPLPPNPQIEAVVNTSTQLGFNPVKVEVAPQVRIEKIENTTQDNRTGLTLKGKGLPNSIVTLYILSDPIVVTVKTDVNGDWTYTLEKPLVAGAHEVFVTVPKSDGSLVRSEVSLFSIAKAAGESQEEGLVLVADSGNKFQIFITYTTGLIMLAVVILLAIFFFRKPQVAEDVVD